MERDREEEPELLPERLRFGERDEDEDEEEEEGELEPERYLRYLLRSLPLTGGLGGGVGRVHRLVLCSAACSEAVRSDSNRDLSAGVSELTPASSGRRVTGDRLTLEIKVALASPAEVRALHSAAVPES